MYKYILLLFILLITNISFANSPTPLESEKLNNPIQLDCGLIIQEFESNKDFQFTNKNINKLNYLCTKAFLYFKDFTRSNGIIINHNSNLVDFDAKFKWNLAFLKEGKCDRCLNDKVNRFSSVSLSIIDLVGYTNNNLQYFFMISDFNNPLFEKIFVHELYHSLTMFYGLDFNYNGNYYKTDEIYAEKFTKQLGY
jgi:hypothetical protein